MSRTYRCRNLPRIIGSPKKLVDGCDRWNGKEFDKKIHTLIAETGLHWGSAYDLVKRTHSEPVGNLCHHPWVYAWGIVGRSKKWYKANGNRRIRRHEKVLLHKWENEGDDFDQPLPKKKDGWDTWSLT